MNDNDMCCGGTRMRKGCEYHDPAMQPYVYVSAVDARSRSHADPYAGHKVGRHATCMCAACNAARSSFPAYLRIDTDGALPEGACGPDDGTVRWWIDQCVRTGHLDPSQVGQVKAEQRPDGGWTITLPGRVHGVSVKGTIEF